MLKPCPTLTARRLGLQPEPQCFQPVRGFASQDNLYTRHTIQACARIKKKNTLVMIVITASFVVTNGVPCVFAANIRHGN